MLILIEYEDKFDTKVYIFLLILGSSHLKGNLNIENSKLVILEFSLDTFTKSSRACLLVLVGQTNKKFKKNYKYKVTNKQTFTRGMGVGSAVDH